MSTAGGARGGTDRNATTGSRSKVGFRHKAKGLKRNMEEELQKLRVALRVLAAITEFREPDETDVQALRSDAPRFTGQSPDELAREVIQQALKARGRASESTAEKV
jgi:hypothetical protein